MTTLIAIDPSIRSCGAAVFRDRLLVDCKRVTTPQVTSLSTEMRLLLMAGEVKKIVDRYAPRNFAIEFPQVYRAGRSKGDPNDLLKVAAFCGLVLGWCTLGDAFANFYTPAQWIGQVPKATKGDPWDCPRGRRIAEKLTAEERVLVPAQHDVIDAVGLGLHHLGRLRARVLPGASR